MNRKIAICLMAITPALLLFSGCFYAEPDYSEPEPEQHYNNELPPEDYSYNEPVPEEPTSVPETPDIPEDTNSDTPAQQTNNYTTMDDTMPPNDVTWVSPGKVMIGNFHAGARAEYPLTIHNGNDVATEFAIYYKDAAKTTDGYTQAPYEVQDWIVIADPTPVIAAKKSIEIMVALEMPVGAETPTDKWEFWVGVKDSSQDELIQTELCTKWLVTMRSG